MQRYQYIPILILMGFLLIAVLPAPAADDPARARLSKYNMALEGPIVPDNWKHHQIGTMWTRVTNFSYMGDDAYEGRTPSGDWPGGSGNSYLYRGTIWLTAKVDGVAHSTQGDDHEFASLDSVWVYSGPGARSEEDTYTRYYDVKAPLATAHFPLGVEIVERSYAWSASWAGDFIIYEYTVKNVGIDSNDDFYPDTPRTLDDFYFTFRIDADVSKLPSWPAEYRFSNQDDFTLSNATPWTWIQSFPKMAGRPHTLTPADLDSSMLMFWDGDNPSYPADNGEKDDFGNPGVDGKLQTPGFLGVKVLKTEPYLKPSSFHICHIQNDPQTDLETWTRMISVPTFDGLIMSKNVPFPHDYRGIITFGPVAKFAPGDSFKVTAALSVGCDPDSGGVYSLMKLVKNMNVAQFIVDNDYNISAEKFTPPTPVVNLETVFENNKVIGVRVVWDDAAITHANFEGFKVWKSSGKTTSGEFAWEPLGAGTYTNMPGGTWPPPAGSQPGTFSLVDPDIINGFDYYYSVQAYTKNVQDPIPLGVIETNILNSAKNITPATPVANTLDNVKVVPNPYIGSAMWNNAMPSDISPWQHRLQFINLPADASIKIFTLDGDFIEEVHAGGTVRQGSGYDGLGPASVAEWDLITRNNQEAAPGMYIYVVDSPSLGNKIGKFVIIQ